MTISVFLVFGVLIVGLAVGIIATTPDVPVAPLVVGLGVAGLLLPVIFYPMSYTMWQAVDLAMHPPERTDPDTPAPKL